MEMGIFLYSKKVISTPLAVKPIGPGRLGEPTHFLALVGCPYLWPAHFFG